MIVNGNFTRSPVMTKFIFLSIKLFFLMLYDQYWIFASKCIIRTLIATLVRNDAADVIVMMNPTIFFSSLYENYWKFP